MEVSQKANWLDRAIGWFNPAKALNRVRARAAANALLSYEAVRSDRRRGSWWTTGASSNAENSGALQKLREDARDLVRNNAFAKKAVREWSKRVVGWGIPPTADTGNAKLNAVIDAYWKQWVPACMSDRKMGFYAAQKLIVRSTFESGECLVRLWTRKLTDGLPVPFQIQVLESDYLDTSRTYPLPSGNIIQGVQYDSIGRIQGYWLFGNHPGEVITTTARGGLVSQLIPSDSVLHHFEVERPGAARAVSRFAPVICKLRDLDEYADAEIIRKKIEACLTAMFTQPEGIDGETNGPAVVDASGKKVESFEPGMVMYGKPGTTAEFFSPASTGDYEAHKKVELHEISAGLDIPFVLMADDLSEVNYSSFRGGLLAYHEAIEEYRWNWFIPQVCDPIWRRFIDTLVLMGVIEEPNYGVKWNPPPLNLLDRKAEAEADQIELQIGKKTWPQLVSEQGNDPKKQVAEIAEWKPQLDNAGVNFFPKIAKPGDNNGQAQDPGAAA